MSSEMFQKLEKFIEADTTGKAKEVVEEISKYSKFTVSFINTKTHIDARFLSKVVTFLLEEGLIEQEYRLLCPECHVTVETSKNIEGIPSDKIQCWQCGYEFLSEKEYIYVSFKLTEKGDKFFRKFFFRKQKIEKTL